MKLKQDAEDKRVLQQLEPALLDMITKGCEWTAARRGAAGRAIFAGNPGSRVNHNNKGGDDGATISECGDGGGDPGRGPGQQGRDKATQPAKPKVLTLGPRRRRNQPFHRLATRGQSSRRTENGAAFGRQDAKREQSDQS